jgi:enamine deaminase RidA (YjgF/YER057c/UK114 family)
LKNVDEASPVRISLLVKRGDFTEFTCSRKIRRCPTRFAIKRAIVRAVSRVVDERAELWPEMKGNIEWNLTQVSTGSANLKQTNAKPMTFPSLLILPCFVALMTSTSCAVHAQKKKSDNPVIYRGNPTSMISASVTIPENKQYFYSSGTVAHLADSSAAAGTRARYGDTRTQAISILERLKQGLAEEGLGLGNVVFMRVYVAPDPQTAKPDFQGWFDAYAQYFGTATNPVKPARSTVGIAQLVNPDLLIEIEIVAVY